ncbi:cell division protein ZapA [Irregularibacter muris]|uniref:Cell division protein ZapA n=1 Tax=Irregularibacter muris TaxID=1796619 RepID=A0AAE3KYM6_9FIRM|nr:cell division protein ZapA [Irregularibacter muris]MCR1897765.1 cell division protein ZapA [Irregularibacter muris]
MEENKKIVISIQGNEYTMKGNVPQEHISKIARQVDYIMDEIGKKNTLMNKNMVAVLCSLNLADQLYRAQERVDELENKMVDVDNLSELATQLKTAQQNADYSQEKYQKVKSELTDANLELARYQEMMQSYEEKIKQDKVEMDAARQTIMDLQNQIFDNQIEIVKMKKELDSYKYRINTDKKIYPYYKGGK